jgi:ATP-dependent Clp protease ATP-binding subunit ClpB
LDSVEATGTVSEKVARAGVEAARRRFSPEFMNRIDKTVVFNPLGKAELRDILKLELGAVQDRVLATGHAVGVRFSVNGAAQEFLLKEGTDERYGARHLKRAVERLLVQPFSNLIASGQIQSGDHIRVTHAAAAPSLAFFREADAFESCEVSGAAA